MRCPELSGGVVGCCGSPWLPAGLQRHITDPHGHAACSSSSQWSAVPASKTPGEVKTGGQINKVLLGSLTNIIVYAL